MADLKPLKPCPFCGSDNVNDTTAPFSAGPVIETGFATYAWVCPDCVAVGPVGTSNEDCTKEWNTRNVSAPVPSGVPDGTVSHLIACLKPLRETRDRAQSDMGPTASLVRMFERKTSLFMSNNIDALIDVLSTVSAMPVGWRLVPIEPTKEMVNKRQCIKFSETGLGGAGLLTMNHTTDFAKAVVELTSNQMRDIYRAMLSAAPTPASLDDGGNRK